MNTLTGKETHSTMQSHLFSQFWFLVVSVSAFLFYIAWDQRLINSVIQLDKSYMASLIALLALFATCHVFATDPMIRTFIDDLTPPPIKGAAQHSESSSDSIVEIHADTLRAPVDLGWFLVDLAIRLGLLGTIIGFILIFTSLSSISLDGAEGLGALLVAMSGGMGTALLTTLSGLVGASFLSMQYLILGRQAEYQIALLIRLRNRILQSTRT